MNVPRPGAGGVGGSRGPSPSQLRVAGRPEPLDLDLSGFSADALVDAVIRLTHRVHTYDEAGHDDLAANARAQRDLARTELLARTDDTTTPDPAVEAAGTTTKETDA